MPELTPELTTEHRLSVIETNLEHLQVGQDRVLKLLESMRKEECHGDCDTAKDLIAIRSSFKTYQRWTWATFAAVLVAGIKAMWP